MRPVRTAARAMLSAVFVANGAQAVVNPDPLVPRAKRMTDRVSPLLEKAPVQLPSDAATLVRINGAVQVLAGLLLASGRGSRVAAAVLAGTLVPTTLAGHAFWERDDPAERRAQRLHFLKNVGMLGGLLLAAADTEGRPSLRYRTGRFVGDRRRLIQRGVRSARRDARIAVKSAAVARHLPG
ncbi:DoxX family protein [Phytohabitans sp. ZYX-F-186]|uniref:DoxX family protein n=1 Tax=Phytohabitans maris TaxID=3071409 RepID=A0ABU0ZJ82_9ACTN|nr:DoxX family protein [Phytohabitans sp. ZYX-F-186]MDQ7907075.1 DoxX family protein [Phytohabitans sp. ZYX-F-186]